MSFDFSVPLLPPSVNHYKNPSRGGGWHRAADAIAFVDAVAIFSRRQKVTGTIYAITLTFHLGPERSKGQNDLDNFLKVAIDALVRAGVIVNDARVLELHAYKRFCDSAREERTEYSITGFSEEKLCLPTAPTTLSKTLSAY